MRFKTLLVFLLCYSLRAFAAAEDTSTIVRKVLETQRAASAPKIDGLLDDEAWKTAQVAGQFTQNSPTEGAPVSFPTEVRIVYDNAGIYIGAMCYDNAPDSIMRQLGLRDDYLTADQFRVVFDTYNTQQDAFDFSVTASGVQSDSRFSDYNFNAVWQSNVKLLENGWSVEILIPWMALRFPTAPKQTWGLQFTRNIQRKFEFDQWALTKKGRANPLRYWGLLSGLDNIDAPVRLSLTPYMSSIWEKDSRFGPDEPSMSVGGGLGLKYGINESFTLDMTLLPDFSQVRSDNVVKNLSPFEVYFQEQRPFFTEGVDLFQRGDIFYSRRIGRTPSEFYSAPDLADSTELITKNPAQARMLNATKLSGRTNEGLGIGVLNAFVANTYAIAQDTVTGDTRRILTEPASNYNVVVFDKQLANSSSVYVINTNVIRSGGYRSANVTGTGFSLNNAKNTWNVFGNGAVSNVLDPTTVAGKFNSSLGYKYSAGFSKTSGNIQLGVSRSEVNKMYDPNDMGINFRTDISDNNAWIGYFIFNPWKCFNSANANISVNYSYNLTSGRMNEFGMEVFSSFVFRNFWNGWFGVWGAPIDGRDYYEPRTPGRFYVRTRLINAFGGLNTNSNKKLYGGIDYHIGSTAQVTATIPANPWGGGGAYLSWRAGNRFTIGMNSGFHGDYGDRGCVDTDYNGDIIFGRRIIRNWETGVNATFVFMRDMNITLTGRHYWATGEYLSYHILGQDGLLYDMATPYPFSKDFSFNSLNIDVVYTWIFAPGSTISIAWKQNILDERQVIDFDYFHNLDNTIHGPQLNQVSVRILYFLDYNYVRNVVSKR